uniref:DUF3421 domain-containing protein n=1 Tax=Anopheles dirus TaxID=7168 RepID=A0A182NGE2_9DIPT
MGEPLYMGRAIYNGLLTPGKVHPSHSCCYLPCKGKEVSVTDYEVLCTRHNHCLERELDTETLTASTSTDEKGGRWQSCINNGPFPSYMVVGGKDHHGNIICVGRAPHAGDMIPAQVIPDRKVAYVCYAGVEIEKNNFEVLLSGKYVREKRSK